MDKKLIILGGAAVAIGGVLLATRKDRSFSEMMDNLEGTVAGKTGKDAQDSMSAVTMSDKDTAYNLARQKFYSAAGKYPPSTWTIEQINEAIGNWDQIRKCLTTYAQYMGNMDRLAEAKANAGTCFDLATAERLMTGAQAEYSVYLEKQKIYDQIVTICRANNIPIASLGVTSVNTDSKTTLSNALTKAHEAADNKKVYDQIVAECKKYGINAADLGITDYVKQSSTTLSNALTKANQLGSLKAKYNDLSDKCRTAGVEISSYIGANVKWYNVTEGTYDSAIAKVKTVYEAAVRSAATAKAKEMWAELNPYRYGACDLATFRDRPQNSSLNLTVSVFQDAINFCAKSSLHLSAWRDAFKAEHQDYPVFRCQTKSQWPYFNTLPDLIAAGIGHSGGATHLTGRGGWSDVEALYNAKKAPLV